MWPLCLLIRLLTKTRACSRQAVLPRRGHFECFQHLTQSTKWLCLTCSRDGSANRRAPLPIVLDTKQLWRRSVLDARSRASVTLGFHVEESDRVRSWTVSSDVTNTGRHDRRWGRRCAEDLLPAPCTVEGAGPILAGEDKISAKPLRAGERWRLRVYEWHFKPSQRLVFVCKAEGHDVSGRAALSLLGQAPETSTNSSGHHGNKHGRSSPVSCQGTRLA